MRTKEEITQCIKAYSEVYAVAFALKVIIPRKAGIQKRGILACFYTA